MATTEVTEQIVREAQPIEELKLGLIRSAQALPQAQLPAYQVAELNKEQVDALKAGVQGIGAYAPYLQRGTAAMQTGTATMGEAADILRGADTRGQFAAAQNAYNLAAQPAAAIGNLSNVAGAGMGYLGAAGQGLSAAQQMAAGASQANLAPSQQMMMAGALQGQEAVQQPGFGAAQGALGMGLGSLAGAAQGYNPYSAQAFMNPYQQAVIGEAMREINRQRDIQGQALQAQAARSGAFGGSREGIQRAELERATAQTRNQAILGALQSGYGAAQQQAQQAFEQQQQRQMAQGQGIANIGNVYGNLAAQQGQLGLASAQNVANIGQQLGAQQLQQAGLGQSAASLYGNLAGQQAGLAGQYAGIAGQQANILGQQSQLQQALGQGIGNLAAQQFGVGQNLAQGLGSLGTQAANLGVQQAAMGQAAQQMGQQDVNFLYNLGSQQQRQTQAELDALRATKAQEALAPQQRLAFISDIYKSAPSSQMAVTQQQQAAPSPFQQIAGVGTGILGTAAAANAASKLF